MVKSLTLALLAGGQSHRFGNNKVLTEFNGKTVAEHMLNLIPAAEKFIICNPTNQKDFFPFENQIHRLLTDEIPDAGPLGGIHTALNNASYPLVMILPSDLPLLNKEFLEYMLQQYLPEYDATIPFVNGKSQPVSAIYHKNLYSPLTHFLQTSSSFSVRKFINEIRVNHLFISENQTSFTQAFLNMNTPEDYSRILKIMDHES